MSDEEYARFCERIEEDYVPIPLDTFSDSTLQSYSESDQGTLPSPHIGTSGKSDRCFVPRTMSYGVPRDQFPCSAGDMFDAGQTPHSSMRTHSATTTPLFVNGRPPSATTTATMAATTMPATTHSATTPHLHMQTSSTPITEKSEQHHETILCKVDEGLLPREDSFDLIWNDVGGGLDTPSRMPVWHAALGKLGVLAHKLKNALRRKKGAKK